MKHSFSKHPYSIIALFTISFLFWRCIPEELELPTRLKSVTTNKATNVAVREATLRGKVTLVDSDTITCGVIYGDSASLSPTNDVMVSTMANGEFSISLSTLKASTTYYYRAYAVEAGRYKYGDILSFKTRPDVSAATGEATNVKVREATLSGTISDVDREVPCGFVYGTSPELTSATGTKVSTASKGKYSVTVKDLAPNTTYYYRAYAITYDEYKYGEVRSFTTRPLATATTGDATDISENRVTLHGTISDTDTPLDCGFIYGTSSSLSLDAGTKVSTTSKGEYALEVTELKANTTYYYRAYVIHEGETLYGDVLSFKTTLEVLVETSIATSITTNSVTLQGTVKNAEKAVTCGFIYGISSTLSSESGSKASTTSNGAYTVNISSLKSNTTYYYRAYVFIEGEYKYGSTRSFKTSLDPSATTGEATNITPSSVTLEGTVSNSQEKLTCGFIYSTSSTLSATSGTKVSTTSNGTYTLNVSSLQASTTYHYRAYVIVEGEYKYGSTRSFKTKSAATATTGEATNITYSSATLGGTVNNSTDKVTCGVIYGTSSTLSATSGTKVSTTSNGAYTVNVSNLQANITYYYRAYVIANGEYVLGSTRSFKTSLDPSATTGEATNITQSSVTLEGTVSNSANTVTCGFIYSTSSTLSATSGTKVSTTSNGTYTLNVSSLQANTTYYYCAYVIVDGEYKYGSTRSFTTSGDVYSMNSTDGWTLSGVNDADTEIRAFESYAGWAYMEIKSGKISRSVTLTAGTYKLTGRAFYRYGEFYYENPTVSLGCMFAGNTEVVVPTLASGSITTIAGASDAFYNQGLYECELKFTLSTSQTIQIGYHWIHEVMRSWFIAGDMILEKLSDTETIPTVTTGEATNVTSNSVTLGGTLNNSNKSVTCGVIYGKTSSLSAISDTRFDTSSKGSFSVKISNLSPSTTYYYRSFAIVDGSWKLGDVRSFTTKSSASVETNVDYVDLGLSVKWASCNIGASSPEGYGGYYAWGETEEKTNYIESTYKYWNQNIGTDISGTEYDVAHVTLGGNWRMPTKEEFEELQNECSWQWTTMNSINGYRVTGPNGNSIFLPAAGYRYGTTEDYQGKRGNTAYYWTSTKYATNRAYNLEFYESYIVGVDANGHNGYDGHSVRPVYGEPSSNVEVSVTTGEATNITASSATLSGTVNNADESVTCGIIYGTSTTLSSTSGTKKSTTSSGSYSISLTGLTANTIYYYCAYVIDAGTYKYGEVKSFTTKEVGDNTGSNKTYTVNGVSFTMIGVEGGTFTMGSPDSDSEASTEEKPAHQVTLSSYYIGETEVTQALWQAVMGSNPSYFTGDLQRPVEQVSWDDCQTFISKLNELTGEDFRLPTEAEWEYAARGGSASKGYKYSGSNTIGDVAWYRDNSNNTTHVVKTKQPNELGIYDMSGNVWEWCSDWYGGRYSSSAQTNPTGPSSGSDRMLRGGSCSSGHARYCRVAVRLMNSPGIGYDDFGLRLVR